jgi:hypothetical protein
MSLGGTKGERKKEERHEDVKLTPSAAPTRDLEPDEESIEQVKGGYGTGAGEGKITSGGES